MKLNNEFVVSADTEKTWRLLTDLERVAPCMPGAALEGREGEDYVGTVKVKVGPIGAQFRGKARFLEQDAANHKATIEMNGKDVKGQAAVKATLRAWLEPEGAGQTRVFVDTDLDISGRMAQFGRGAIADVSNRLIGQFTENLSRELDTPRQQAAGAPAPAAAAAEPASTDLNLIAVLGPTIAKQAVGPLVGLLIGILIGRGLRRQPRPVPAAVPGSVE